MRKVSSRKKSISLFKLFLPIFGILLIVFSFFLFRSNFFTIKKVEVETEKINCADYNQVRDSSELFGKNFFFLNSSRIENYLKKKFICIKAVEISRIFPDKVKLRAFGRNAEAILASIKSEEAINSAILENFAYVSATPSAQATPSASFNFSIDAPSENFLVDSEGVIYSTNIEQVNVPKIYFYGQNLILGRKIEGDLIKNTLKILDKVKSFAVDIKEAKIYSKSLLLINSSPRIIFKLDLGVDTQLASLQLILNQAKINKDYIEFIDLRFDKPIIKLAPKK